VPTRARYIRPDRCKPCRGACNNAKPLHSRVDISLQGVGRHASCSASGVRSDDSLPLMLWSARPDLSCEHASPAWLEFTGCSAAQAAGEGWTRCVHAEDLARWLDACLRGFDSREPYEIEYRLRRHDGEYRWMLDRAAPRFSPEGTFLGFSAECIDIHERKQAERALERSLERERRGRSAAEQASRAKDAFLASVLAQLRAPARAIAGWAEKLRGQPAGSGDSAGALEAIERSARNQERVIANLLELSGEAPPPDAGDAPAPLLAGVRALVVERDANTREALVKMLRLGGAETRAVASPALALEALGDWQPDVMVSDFGESDDDGYVLIRALPPRVVATGYDAQLAKPVEPVALLATLARLMQPAGT